MDGGLDNFRDTVLLILNEQGDRELTSRPTVLFRSGSGWVSELSVHAYGAWPWFVFASTVETLTDCDRTCKDVGLVMSLLLFLPSFHITPFQPNHARLYDVVMFFWRTAWIVAICIEGRCGVVGSTVASGSKDRGFDPEHRYFSQHMQAKITGVVPFVHYSVRVCCSYSASYPSGKANRVGGYQW